VEIFTISNIHSDFSGILSSYIFLTDIHDHLVCGNSIVGASLVEGDCGIKFVLS
jgi:hypothetical protein